MARTAAAGSIDDFLGSVHIFASAVNDVVERRLLAQVSRGQLTVAQLKLLKLVARANSHSLGDVASVLGVSNAAASKAVDRLVRRNLVRRAEDRKDRRAMRLSLAPAARRLLTRYAAAKRRKLAGLFARYPAARLRAASELLDRLSAGLDSHAGELCLQCGLYFRERCPVRQLAGRRCFYQRHQED